MRDDENIERLDRFDNDMEKITEDYGIGKPTNPTRRPYTEQTYGENRSYTEETYETQGGTQGETQSRTQGETWGGTQGETWGGTQGETSGETQGDTQSYDELMNSQTRPATQWTRPETEDPQPRRATETDTQPRRAVEEDQSGTSEQGSDQSDEEPQYGEQTSEVSGLGGAGTVATDEVTPPADLAQQRAQGPGHDYRFGTPEDEKATDEAEEVMPKKSLRTERESRDREDDPRRDRP
ncbi:hypothetical protein [Raineyella fluvialis]|uniref:Uncharacterized protein n=1 Tax=Raineyella fluvialis TaxID=2662261 RepID=A0A5Q2FFB3_9ACTN|nr:hypothetical protein [Raineyella fluvialis]QGF23803.1 hypothetical protein Rai3103_09095 [Raineyella fluvialis]